MHQWILFSTAIFGLTACSTTSQQIESNLAGANPASQHCIEQGGKLELRQNDQGQTGYCHLKDGHIVEEWLLYREKSGQCNPEKAKQLMGLKNLSEQQIQQHSQASLVRQIQAGQAVTQDYRVERITVVVDPKSKLISHASCG